MGEPIARFRRLRPGRAPVAAWANLPSAPAAHWRGGRVEDAERAARALKGAEGKRPMYD